MRMEPLCGGDHRATVGLVRLIEVVGIPSRHGVIGEPAAILLQNGQAWVELDAGCQ